MKTYPFGFPSGDGMVPYVDKITNFELVRDLLGTWSLPDLCLLRLIFFLARPREYLTASRSRRLLSSPRYLILGDSNFLGGVRGSLPKSRKKELSLEWIVRSILKLKRGICTASLQSCLPWMCLLMHVFYETVNFSKMPLDCGWYDLKKWCFMPNLSATFLGKSFLNSFSLSVNMVKDLPKVVYMFWRYACITVSTCLFGMGMVMG